jgi:hypothetical protein
VGKICLQDNLGNFTEKNLNISKLFPNLEWFDVDAGLVLFLDGIYDAFDDDLCDVVNVPATLGGGDTVHE